MKHRRVGLVIIGTVDATGADDTQRRAFRLHRADLHGRGVGAQHMRWPIVAFGTGHVKRVHFGTGRVVAGDVQRIEIIPIGINARPFGDRKPKFGKNGCNLFGHLTDRVDRALACGPCRQCHVEPFRPQTFIKCGVTQRGLLGGDG